MSESNVVSDPTTAAFHPAVAAWFARAFDGPTAIQQRGWPLIRDRANVLMAAPTGSGKTLAAFLAVIDRLFRDQAEGRLENETRVVYVSPLRALSHDIHRNLTEPLAGIQAAAASAGLDVAALTKAVRTGDTSARERRLMVQKPPHILVTTPESLYLLLTAKSGRNMLHTVDTVIVDEIHALADNRRGSHLTLSLERLAHLCARPLQRIGLSATQNPMSEVARFLVGPNRDCRIIDEGHLRRLDLALCLPDSPLEAVMSAEVWMEIYRQLAELIEDHRTTLIFVNTRRLAERVTFNLKNLLGGEAVAAHHGSMAAEKRLSAEARLKEGSLKALVATASLELGIDIGSVDLVCQLGTPRTISAFLQRIGRSGHHLGGVPKGRLFPLSRDELVEGVAMLAAVKRGELDKLIMPPHPLDVLSQQIVATCADGEWDADALFALCREAYPYRDLDRRDFEKVVVMLADGITTKRGRRGAHIFYDRVNGTLRARKGARLAAITSGGAIPDLADYQVVLEPGNTIIGTLNEDFAVESMPGDVFQLGNQSWRIRKVDIGKVFVEDAQGAPPSIPFWFGEAPSRGIEFSAAVARLRREAQTHLENPEAFAAWLSPLHVPQPALDQLFAYFAATYKALGVIPSQDQLVIERFFDASGGMQLVIHAPFGSRLNRAWGLALRKRFCRSFNFELQAAATEDAIVLSLGPKHAFPLDGVFDYLSPKSARTVLVQALLDAPMFQTRWRWNATRALAMLRMRGGRRVPAQLQRMEAEDLIAIVFPDQLACLENIAGDREVPDHPLVSQTIEDCLFEVMDVGGLEQLLIKLQNNEIEKIAVDVPEPSPMAHEVLNAKPYAFLDDAPLEERRTQAVQLRRGLDLTQIIPAGFMDESAVDAVVEQVWPQPESTDEMHEALVMLGALGDDEIAEQPEAGRWRAFLDDLVATGRVTRARIDGPDRPWEPWTAVERLPLWRTLFPDMTCTPALDLPEILAQDWESHDARVDLLRGRLELCGPVTVALLQRRFPFSADDLDAAFLALEGEGMVLRGAFDPRLEGGQWCNRRILARIHQRTLQRLRAEIQPVGVADLMRFLFDWQHLSREHKVRDLEGLEDVLLQLEGFEAAAGAWEKHILRTRAATYLPSWLDQLSLGGKVSWGRLKGPQTAGDKPFRSGPLRTTPITFFYRGNEDIWRAPPRHDLKLSGYAREVHEILERSGAVFFNDLVKQAGLLATQVEMGLGELVALGMVTSDSFAGLRALISPAKDKPSLTTTGNPGFRRRYGARRARGGGVQGIQFAGRWTLLAEPMGDEGGFEEREEVLEYQARTLLRRYGVVFRKLLEREKFAPKWRDLLTVYRRMEAVGELRGGHFVTGCSGEHFALPEALGGLRAVRRRDPDEELVVVNACDPLNLCGILLPGDAVERHPKNRIVFKNGEPVAAWVGGEKRSFAHTQTIDETQVDALITPRK
ncbi:DEAD/DEAH box helicase [Acanthopleuribacter pedis]|uniref:DEAD/DEAH box helicase n=1 Tax=Acanthopleuribacter pedis TaxID=442870 RepID=A0A8J7U3K7_9BACT|nr:DEAD/DEAH box helicase [Acanthopleuribacter pedis]MBO1318448.1 DEAD/DEAH box helicase [Acanthopleuribacter pedis]